MCVSTSALYSRPEGAEVKFIGSALDGQGVRRSPYDPEAHPKREDIAHRDGSLRRDGVLERPVDALQHPPVRKLREPPIDRRVEPQNPVLDQHHRHRCGHGLGHRRDAEDRVAGHWRAAPEALLADCLHVDVAPVAHRVRRAGHAPARDVPCHRVVNPPKLRGEGSGGRGLLHERIVC